MKRSFRASRRYDSNRLPSHRVNNGQQTAICHANEREPILAVVLTIIDLLDCKRVFENAPRRLKADAMLGVVGLCLFIVPAFTRFFSVDSVMPPPALLANQIVNANESAKRGRPGAGRVFPRAGMLHLRFDLPRTRRQNWCPLVARCAKLRPVANFRREW